MNSIAFSGTHIKNINIMAYDQKSKKYMPYEAALVELKRSYPLDSHAIENCSKSWKPNYFLTNILEDFDDTHYNTGRFFAITTQQHDYNIMQDNKILGFAQVSKEKNL